MATLRTYGLRDNMLRAAILDHCNRFVAARQVREWTMLDDSLGLVACLDSCDKDASTDAQRDVATFARRALDSTFDY